MAIRGKSLTHEKLVAGDVNEWVGRTQTAMADAGFTKVQVGPDREIRGSFHKGTVWGELTVAVEVAGAGVARLRLTASGAKDNIWTVLKGDPTERIIDRFLRCLPEVSASAVAPHSVAAEIARLAELRNQGALSNDEFTAAKARLLS